MPLLKFSALLESAVPQTGDRGSFLNVRGKFDRLKQDDPEPEPGAA